MTSTSAKLAFRQLVLAGLLLILAVSFVEPLTAVAQETDDGQATSSPEPSSSDSSSGSSAEQAKAVAEASSGDGSEATKAAEGAPAPNSVLGELVADHGISADQVATLDRVKALDAQAHREIAALEARLEPLEKRLTFFETSSVVLDEQLSDESLPDEARQSLACKAATMRARLGMTEAMVAGIRAPIESRRKLIDLLAERAENLRREAKLVADQAQRQQVRINEAAAAEKAALAEAERAKAREARERDAQVRRLISKRREVLEQIADVARHQTEQIQEASERRAERVEEFAKAREEFEAKISAFPGFPTQSYAQQAIDPVFRKLLEHRREVRDSLRLHRNQVDNAQDKLDAANEALELTKERVETAREELDELGQTVVGEQKVKLAEAQRDLEARKLEAYRDIAQARQKQLALDREQLDYYNESIERLLPRISDAQRDKFYSIFSDENWQSAWFGVLQALERSVDIAEMRLQQALELPTRLTSVELWGWILGLLGWFLLLGGVIYVSQHYTDPLIRKLTGWALRRRFFQRYARVTIKAAEVLRSIIRPVVLYLVIDKLVAYVADAFGELVFLGWAVDAFFLFWVVMTLVKVMVLPRRYREQAGRSPAPDLVQIGASDGRQSLSAVDVITIEITRAQKLVRSVRIILVFWLLEHYVPRAVTELVGHSVISWLVKTFFVWGLAIVVYMVLSTWKDDIAALFVRLAEDRLPRSVEFVKNHKDRFYGVLVIAVAFIYVAFREIGQFARTHASDTEWSKRVSNFVFRKRIEMQQKERSGEEVDTSTTSEPLPDDYAAYFEQRPLDDENYKVIRQDQLEYVVADARAFLRDGRPQGSLAISAEQGMGKTSLLNDVSRAFAKEFPDLTRKYTSLASKVVDDGVLGFLADLFELDEVPESRVELVEALRELEPRVLLIDDCHHFFVREIGGFAGLDTFLEVVNLTDDIHYWVLTFNKYAWNYINRVRPRKHYFGQILELRPWNEREIQDLVQRRNALAGRNISFTDLVVAHEEGDHDFYEIIKTANGYFRLLHEFSGGNPMVALRFWKRSVKPNADGDMQVSLFRKPSMQPVQQLSDDYLFALAAIAQHGALDAGEIAEIINSDRAFCEMALNYFEEREIVELDPSGRRAYLSPLYFRQVVKKLSASNFLWD
ncbi:hypothetical protein FIV42_29475 [Persicimonas caeni]|uniref:Uncharacterized protein n=1 Tax=Persicimonas caeni TaxID=2292766 RepID=A0A4Y6Q3J5_PERCE|nr:hypothetical protein [Persicimonas caeni]QDG54727.1 hypothetical protein FIV42_29475 [Persicimonas caeni]QED35948.1 hypothetical protein FRD00_29470 [Persicimonas caeni]